MIHRGQLLREKIEQSGIKYSDVAKRIGISRQHLYNLFNKINVSLEVIIEVGKIIHHDFSNEIPELRRMKRIDILEPEVKYVTRDEMENFLKNILSDKDQEIQQLKDSIRLRDEKIKWLEEELEREKKIELEYTS